MSIFLGPLSGFLDVNEADLTLTGEDGGVPSIIGSIGTIRAGDFDGDGIPDIVVGHPWHGGDVDIAGEVRVFSGAALRAALGR